MKEICIIKTSKNIISQEDKKETKCAGQDIVSISKIRNAGHSKVIKERKFGLEGNAFHLTIESFH